METVNSLPIKMALLQFLYKVFSSQTIFKGLTIKIQSTNYAILKLEYTLERFKNENICYWQSSLQVIT